MGTVELTFRLQKVTSKIYHISVLTFSAFSVDFMIVALSILTLTLKMLFKTPICELQNIQKFKILLYQLLNYSYEVRSECTF